ncbi:hypothetical protein pb186bvf_012543 [Paramecium bursaria]
MYPNNNMPGYLYANCVITFCLVGYVLSYLNPALQTIDVILDIDQQSNGGLSASLSFGAAIGSYLSIYFIDQTLRNVFLFSDIIVILGVIFTIFSTYSLIFIGRIIIGIGISIQFTFSLFFMQQFKITINGVVFGFGIITSFLQSYMLSNEPSKDDFLWRIMFGILIIFCLIKQCLLCSDDTRNTDEFQLTIQQNPSPQGYQDGIFIAIIQQFLGINAFLSYSTYIFNQLSKYQNQILQTHITRIANVCLTIILCKAAEMNECCNTQKNCIIGILGCTISMFILGSLPFDPLQDMTYQVLLVYTYIFFYSFSLSSRGWIQISKLPTQQSINCLTISWLCFAFVIWIFPLISLNNNFYFYAFTGTVSILYLAFIFDDKQETEFVQEQELAVRFRV